MLLEIFALIVLGVLAATVIGIVVMLGPVPGNVAQGRGHPQADAIRALGWIGIIALGPAWLAALVWAYTKPIGTAGLPQRVAALEDELRQLKGGQPGDTA